MEDWCHGGSLENVWWGTRCCGYHLYTLGVVFSLQRLLWCCLRRRDWLTVETKSDATVWTARRCLTSKKCVWKYLNVSVSSVEPPTNVTFRCHNLHDLLQWSYEPLVAGLRFRVNIFSLQRSLAERPTGCCWWRWGFVLTRLVCFWPAAQLACCGWIHRLFRPTFRSSQTQLTTT